MNIEEILKYLKEIARQKPLCDGNPFDWVCGNEGDLYNCAWRDAEISLAIRLIKMIVEEK